MSTTPVPTWVDSQHEMSRDYVNGQREYTHILRTGEATQYKTTDFAFTLRMLPLLILMATLATSGSSTLVCSLPTFRSVLVLTSVLQIPLEPHDDTNTPFKHVIKYFTCLISLTIPSLLLSQFDKKGACDLCQVVPYPLCLKRFLL